MQTIKRSLVAWRLELAHLPFVEYLKRVLLHHRACFRRRDGRTPAEVVFGRNLRLPLASKFGFGERVQVQAGPRGMRAASFLMQRGSNTAFVIDADSSRLRLAHDEQLAPSVRPLDPLRCASSPKVTREVPNTEEPIASPSPSSEDTRYKPRTLPMATDDVPSTPVPARPKRLIKTRRVLDYNDL